MKCREQRNSERLGWFIVIGACVGLFLWAEPDLENWAVSLAQGSDCRIVQTHNAFGERVQVCK
jgi:hypothetical protein